MNVKTFHHSTLASPRLQKLLAFLTERGAAGATTLEITQHCLTTRASSDVSELVANGLTVTTGYEGKTEDGRKIHRYTLVAAPISEPPTADCPLPTAHCQPPTVP